MSHTFHNPYHFVPAQKVIPEISDFLDDSWPNRENIGRVTESTLLTPAVLGPASFDRYHKGALSGKMVCRLTTVGPTVIGEKQEPAGNDNSGTVYPFELDNKPAIPGSTLKGCISSVAEALSNSAMRVLDDTHYSRRAAMDEALSAMGMIVAVTKKDEKTGESKTVLKLKPLALPVLEKDSQTEKYYLPPRFEKVFPGNPHKCYCFLKTDLPVKKFLSHSSENRKFYYAKLGGYHIKSDRFVADRFLIGQKIDGTVEEKQPNSEYVRGVLRILHTESRKDDMPRTKTHELFIPYTPEMEKDHSDLLDIETSVLEKFRKIAKSAACENERRKKKGQDPLPFCLKGTEEFEKRDYSLKNGDIVFFDVTEDGTVSELSISQIWRKQIPVNMPATAHSFFKGINPELLPFNPERKRITPAELLFGFVEEKVTDKNKARSLAGRLRFGNAELIGKPENGNAYLPEDTMRILASPKPPCPPLYFRKKSAYGKNVTRKDCHIAKKDLDPNDHIPKGRKFYLHHENKNRWKTEKDEQKTRAQKNRVRPLAPGCVFMFSADFENLMPAELGLLAHSLSPSDDFLFKIGMGKPLGLGSVKIEVVGVLLTNRLNRYSSDHFINAKRYETAWVKDKEGVAQIREWNKKIGACLPKTWLPSDCPLIRCVDEFTSKTDALRPIRQCVEAMGSVSPEEVCYPVREHQHPEEETFKWFVENDKKHQKKSQGLPPLDYSQERQIPALEKN